MVEVFKNSKNVIVNIDEYFNNVTLGILNFKEGVNNYLDGNFSEFEANLNKIEQLEEKADSIIQKIENYFYIHSLMPNYYGDILMLLERVDDIIDKVKDKLQNKMTLILNISTKSVEVNRHRLRKNASKTKRKLS